MPASTHTEGAAANAGESAAGEATEAAEESDSEAAGRESEAGTAAKDQGAGSRRLGVVEAAVRFALPDPSTPGGAIGHANVAAVGPP